MIRVDRRIRSACAAVVHRREFRHGTRRRPLPQSSWQAPHAQVSEDTMTDLTPQAKQMADESMVRNLEAQARAIWPQEVPLLQRYRLPPDLRILDAGCGTGEGASRLAEMFPLARVLGVDIIDSHL